MRAINRKREDEIESSADKSLNARYAEVLALREAVRKEVLELTKKSKRRLSK
ncbi:hypothetical protein [Bradyrhizobium sp.]|uniref:hypothetical protein n=1 Tax=Bradyrhizobium sp. TaxID=376 RepID=UPI0023A4F7C6|nr:hypothetical protein [Bradyrhizobium sp.]MDE2379864.1 hypothetical protein [Bradyrhizobium sp.]